MTARAITEPRSQMRVARVKLSVVRDQVNCMCNRNLCSCKLLERLQRALTKFVVLSYDAVDDSTLSLRG